MKMPSFSIRTLLGVIAVVGVAFAVFLASGAWTGFFVCVFAAMLGTAVLAALYRSGEKRAFWIGFTVFASIYCLASRTEFGHNYMPSTKVMETIAARYVPPQPVFDLSNPPALTNRDERFLKYFPWGAKPTSPFIVNGHLICSIAMGLLGGIIALALYRTQDQQPS